MECIVSDDVKSRLNYLNERFNELARICALDEDSEEVAAQVPNITTDLLQGLTKLLDMIMFEYYADFLRPTLSDMLKKKYDSKVQFPLESTEENLLSQLGRFGQKDLKTIDYSAFSIIERHQPYKSGDQHLKTLRAAANLSHRKLMRQRKQRTVMIDIGGAITLVGALNVHVKNVQINGRLIDDMKVNSDGVSGQFDSALTPVKTVVTYYIMDGFDVDVLELCEKSLREVDQIAGEFAQR
jgi:hypothetical protein